MDAKDFNDRQTYFAYLRTWAYARSGSADLPERPDTVEQAAAAAIAVRDAKSNAMISSMATVLADVEHLLKGRPDQ